MTTSNILSTCRYRKHHQKIHEAAAGRHKLADPDDDLLTPNQLLYQLSYAGDKDAPNQPMGCAATSFRPDRKALLRVN